MKYLIIGIKGQLGREFEKQLTAVGADFLGVDIEELDICNMAQAIEFVTNNKPDVILNCAAYTAVDNAQTDKDTAFAVNALGPDNLAMAAKDINALLVHYSTDYVFSGDKSTPYIETDKAEPISNYGASKLVGESLVINSGAKYLIFRLSWVYGDGNQNFIHKLTQWAQGGAELKIADNEVSVPTYTGTIASTTFLAIDKRLKGLYHLTSSGYCSRYEWACFVLKELGMKNKIVPVNKGIFNLPALRPDFSAMDNSLLSKELGIVLPEWKEDLKKYLSKIKV